MDSAIDWLVEWWTRGAFFTGWMVAWWTRGLLGEMAEGRRLEAEHHRNLADASRLAASYANKLALDGFELPGTPGIALWNLGRFRDEQLTAAKASDLRAALLERDAEQLRRRPLRFMGRNALMSLRARVTRGGADHA